MSNANQLVWYLTKSWAHFKLRKVRIDSVQSLGSPQTKVDLNRNTKVIIILEEGKDESKRTLGLVGKTTWMRRHLGPLFIFDLKVTSHEQQYFSVSLRSNSKWIAFFGWFEKGQTLDRCISRFLQFHKWESKLFNFVDLADEKKY